MKVSDEPCRHCRRHDQAIGATLAAMSVVTLLGDTSLPMWAVLALSAVAAPIGWWIFGTGSR